MCVQLPNKNLPTLSRAPSELHQRATPTLCYQPASFQPIPQGNQRSQKEENTGELYYEILVSYNGKILVVQSDSSTVNSVIKSDGSVVK